MSALATNPASLNWGGCPFRLPLTNIGELKMNYKKLKEYNEVAEIKDRLDDVYQDWDFRNDDLNGKGDVILDVLHHLEVYQQTLAEEIKKEVAK